MNTTLMLQQEETPALFMLSEGKLQLFHRLFWKICDFLDEFHKQESRELLWMGDKIANLKRSLTM